MAAHLLLLIGALGVSIDDPGDPALARAVENQLADLAIELVEPGTASVAITIRNISAGFKIEIVHGDPPQTIVREVRSRKTKERLRASALYEGVGLAIRGVLQALLIGGPIEEPEPPPEVIEEEPFVEEELASKPATPPPEAALGIFASIGWSASLASAGFELDHTITVRGGLGFGRIEVGAELGLGVPLGLEDEHTELALSRHRFAALLGARLVQTEALVLLSGLSAGATLLRRTVSALAGGVTASPARTDLGFVAGVELRLRIARPLGLELALGVDLHPGSPVLAYTQNGAQVERGRIDVVEPKLGLSLSFFSP